MTGPALADERHVTAVLGPTNTGKTHYAIERMLLYRTGVMGLPLRLLAREVYDKIVEKRGPSVVALITGEEKIVPPRAQYFVCTVEAMPLENGADFVAVDEIQLCADPDRGHIFTDRLLNARGTRETLFMGSDVMRERIRSLVPKARFMGRERFSTLLYSGQRKISRLKPRTAVVAFSVDQVYAIAELIRRQRGGAAVVMGALSPRTRNAQVALYQDGDVDYLVATDAIGMGLNLDVEHIAFAGTSKFDGHRHRQLMANEIGQIAGRAGRYTRDGTFGVTGEARPFDEDLVRAIETHRFKPIAKLHWRNGDLAFATVPRLIESLERPPTHQDLMRAREADDLEALRLMWSDIEVQKRCDHPNRVRLLWDVCQIPDFRKVMTGDHVALLARIFHFLTGPAGVIPSDWIEGQVSRLDRVDGDIDALSKRLAYIRTWTYVANRGAWVEDPAAWRERTRAVEDKLSDALHERLTQRFVDRRTSVLMRRLKQKERLVAEVNENGEVTVEGEFAGRLDGFRFTADESAAGAEGKVLRSASLSALQQEFARRADKLYNSPDTEIALTEQGGLMWGTDAVGALQKGDGVLAPKIRVFVDDIADAAVAEKVERRLSHWLDRRTKTLFEPMLAMQADETVTGLARGVAFQIAESMGVVVRRDIADDVKALAQEERAQLRKHGVRFGQHHVFMPALLKPKPTALRLVLWGLGQGFDALPSPPPPGQVTVAIEGERPAGYWTMAGYRATGARAVRIDMLERLADMIRPMDAKAGFEATADMLSITGCTLDQFADIMQGLGFQATKGERPKPARKPEPAPAETTPTAEDALPVGTEAEASSAEATAASAIEAMPASEVAAGEMPDVPAPAPTPESASAPAEVVPAEIAPAEIAPAEIADAQAPASPETAAEVAPPDAPALIDTADPVTEAEPTTAAIPAVSSPPPEAPPAGVATATTTEAEAEAPDTETEAADAPAAAPEVEAFYTFTLKPRGRPNRGPRREDGTEGQSRGPRRRGGVAGSGAGAERRPDGAEARPGGGSGSGGGRRDRDDARHGGGRGRPVDAPADAAPGRRPKGKPAAAEGAGGPRGDTSGPRSGAKGGGPRGGKPDQGRPDHQQRPDQRKDRRPEKQPDPDSPFAVLAQLKNK